MAPGWFRDPSGSYLWRWWDGRAWTAHVAPLANAIDTRPINGLIDAEIKAGTGVRIAVVAYQAIIALTAVLNFAYAAQWRTFFHALYGFFQDPLAGNSLSAVDTSIPVFNTGYSFLLEAVWLGATVVVMIWQYRAATAARRVGIPARHSPTWGVVAHFVPIANFWVPGQAVRDLFPSGHRGRRLVTATWFLVIGAGLVGAAEPFAAFAGVPLRILILVVELAITLWMGTAARKVISEAVAVHREAEQAIAQRTTAGARSDPTNVWWPR